MTFVYIAMGMLGAVGIAAILWLVLWVKYIFSVLDNDPYFKD